ncbi:MAG TPA: benzoyl-CoA reductase subunit D [Kofleriaceae bacterium]|jgi:benzoyl-CoA reductase subunit D|nr:benzoyl-CoA reductase subunit D [Kofleriaceae bacterium]
MTTIISAGIDVGSSAVKAVILASPAGSGRRREGARVLAMTGERIRRRDQRHVIELAWTRALTEAGVAAGNVHYLATTGEGELVEQRTGHFYGMTAHARGALFLDPEARAVLDAGALHARAIRMDEHGRVLAYRMTSQCASGSGQFLENIARYLGVTLDEVGPLSLRADAPEKVSGVCAVLAETDAINMVSRGISLPNILAGIHESMAQRCTKLLRSCDAGGVVLVTGGLCADEGLLAALSEACSRHKTLDATMRTHPQGAYAGALGAALWGAYRWERLRRTETHELRAIPA